MKVAIITDEGMVIDVVENVEQYDLSKPLAASDLIDEIKRAIKIATED